MSFGISTLGPCAEAMGISVMMVFCLGVVQLPVMIALAMHVPSVRVDLYTPYMVTGTDPSSNLTAVVLPREAEGPIHASYMHGINISGLFVLCASGFTFFVVLTMQFIERGLHGQQDSGLLAASFQVSFLIRSSLIPEKQCLIPRECRRNLSPRIHPSSATHPFVYGTSPLSEQPFSCTLWLQ